MRMEKPPRKYTRDGLGCRENISVTAWNALCGVFFPGATLEYRQKTNRPIQGGLSYFVSLRISARTANGKARISRRIMCSPPSMSGGISWDELQIHCQRLHPFPCAAVQGLAYNPCMNQCKRVILEGIPVFSSVGAVLPAVVIRENAGLKID